MNYAATKNSILIEVLTESGRAALGARIEIVTGEKRQLDEVRSGGYHISHSDFRVHFGIGEIEELDINILWPKGHRTTYSGVQANSWVTISEGDKKIQIKKKFTRSVKK